MPQLPIAVISIFSTNSGNRLLNDLSVFFSTSKSTDSFGLSKFSTGLRIDLSVVFFYFRNNKFIRDTVIFNCIKNNVLTRPCGIKFSGVIVASTALPRAEIMTN